MGKIDHLKIIFFLFIYIFMKIVVHSNAFMIVNSSLPKISIWIRQWKDITKKEKKLRDVSNMFDKTYNSWVIVHQLKIFYI